MKKNEKGGFESMVYLEFVELEENNPHMFYYDSKYPKIK